MNIESELKLDWIPEEITSGEWQYNSPPIGYGFCRVFSSGDKWIWYFDQSDDGQEYSEKYFDNWKLAAFNFETIYRHYIK